MVKIVSFNTAQQVEPMVKDIIEIYGEAFGQAPYFKDAFRCALV